MSDIFISYARADREIARRLAETLEARGWSVWWDRRLHGGQSFDRVIEEAITAARSVIVIWSKKSVGSDWVRAEATYGLEVGKLVPVRIDDVPVPLRFRNVHTTDLSAWADEDQAAPLDLLIEDLSFVLDAPPSPQGPDSGSADSVPEGAAARSAVATPEETSPVVHNAPLGRPDKSIRQRDPARSVHVTAAAIESRSGESQPAMPAATDKKSELAAEVIGSSLSANNPRNSSFKRSDLERTIRFSDTALLFIVIGVSACFVTFIYLFFPR